MHPKSFILVGQARIVWLWFRFFLRNSSQHHNYALVYPKTLLFELSVALSPRPPPPVEIFLT